MHIQCIRATKSKKHLITLGVLRLLRLGFEEVASRMIDCQLVPVMKKCAAPRFSVYINPSSKKTKLNESLLNYESEQKISCVLY